MRRCHDVCGAVARWVTLLGLACALAVAGERDARADEGPAPSDARRAAAGAFADGEKAFAAGDYSRAAQAFDEAHRLAPHPAALWNAARSYHRLGELARAANHYARYLRLAPADARDRDAATKELAVLAARLGRIDVFAPGAERVMIDGQAADDRTVYVNPGSHVLTAVVDGRDASRSVELRAGESRSVAFERAGGEPAATAPPVPARSPPARAAESPPAPSRGLSPAFVIAGAGATAVALGFTIASGVDTMNALSTFEADKSTENLESGRGKELRTNVLIGVTAGLAAITAATAIWLVDWRSRKPATPGRSSEPAVRLAVGPGAVAAIGSF
jgi:hypothetical protein